MGAKSSIGILAVLFAVAFIAGTCRLYMQAKRAGDRWPALNEPGSLTAELRRLDGEIAALRNEAARIPAAREELAALQAEYELAAGVLPGESAPDRLIDAIRAKARQAGVVLSRLTPAVVRRQESGEFEEWRFSLSLTGSYDQIADFVNRMEEFERDDPEGGGAERLFFQVQSIGIAAAGNGLTDLAMPAEGSAAGHECSLVMRTYRYAGVGRRPSASADDGLFDSGSLEELRAHQAFRYRAGGRDPMIVRTPAARESGRDAAASAVLTARIPTRAEKMPRQTLSNEEREEIDQEFIRLDVRVNGVSWSPTGARAVINDRLVETGETLLDIRPSGDLSLEAVEPRAVVFRYKGCNFRREVELYGNEP